MADDISTIGFRVTETGTAEVQRKLSDLEKQAQRTAGKGSTSGGFGGLGSAIEDAARAAAATEGRWASVGNVIGTDLRNQADLAAGNLGALGRVMLSLGPWGLLAAAGIGALSFGLAAGVSEVSQYEQAIKGLETSLRAAGNSTGFSQKQLLLYADTLEDATLFTEEQVIAAMGVINEFGRVSGDQFKRVTELVLDMAQRMKTDPADAARALLRALQDPEQGIAQLKRSFSSLGPEMVDTVKQMIAVGDRAGAMTLILETLTDRVGGGARHASDDTIAGAFTNAADAAGDFLRELARITGTAEGTKSVLNLFAVTVGAAAGAMQGQGVEATDNYKLAMQGLSAMLQVVGLDLASNLALIEATGKAQDKNTRSTDSFAEIAAQAVAKMDAWRIATAKAADEQKRADGFLADYIKRLEAEAALGSRTPEARAIAIAGEVAVQKALTEAKGRDISLDVQVLGAIRKKAQEVKAAEIAQVAAFQNSAAAAKEAERAAKKAREELFHLLQEGVKGATDADAALRKYLVDLKHQTDVAGLSGDELARQNALFAAQQLLLDKAGVAFRKLTEDEKRTIEQQVQMRETLARTNAEMADIASGIGSAFDGLIGDLEQGGESAEQAGLRFAKALVEMVFRVLVLTPLVRELTRALQEMNAANGGGGLLGMLGFGGGSEAAAFSIADVAAVGAKGLAFGGGNVIPMAKGHVVNKPTMRPMALMGEAGPEAVVPLQRMSDGRLGVSSVGGGNGAGVIVQNIDQRSKGQPVETKTSQGPNGETIIRNMIRDEVQGAMRDGSMDKTLQRAYGLKRSPVKR